MARSEKLVREMRSNPHADWRIEDLKAVAARHGIAWRAPGGSHVTFRTPHGARLTVPARRPIKAVYIRLFVRLIEEDPEP
jgi:predicted RNA binding protein YcfA (HicA-like mRNA interferase family)